MIMSAAIFTKLLNTITPLACVGLLAQIWNSELPTNWLQLGVSGGSLFVLLAQMIIHQRTIGKLVDSHRDAMKDLVDTIKDKN